MPVAATINSRSNTQGYKNVTVILPQKREIEELRLDRAKVFINRHTVVYEKLFGSDIIIYSFNRDVCRFYDKDRKELDSSKDAFNIKISFDLRYKETLKKLSELFNGVEFILYAQIVGFKVDNRAKYFDDDNEKRFVFHDIYLNGNWINWDDFKEIAISMNFPISTILFDGYLTESDLNDITKRAKGDSAFSSKKGVPINGVVLKSFLEDEVNGNRLIAKIINPKFHPKLVQKVTQEKNIKNRKKLSDEVDNFLVKQVDEAEVVFWKFFMENDDVDIKNVAVSFPSIVNSFLLTKDKEIITYCTANGFDKKQFIKMLKKKLPKIIKKEFEL